MNQADRPSHQKKTLTMLPMYADPAGEAAAQAGAPHFPPRLDQGFVTGSLSTPAGSVPRVSPDLQWRDRWGTIKARWGIGRMDYAIDPGLYALGSPNRASAVLVSANYKMSFDRMRGSLQIGRAHV